MFSRTSRTRGSRGKHQPITPKQDTSVMDDPVVELSYLIDRLSSILDAARDSYEERLRNPFQQDAVLPSSPLNFFRRRKDIPPKEASFSPSNKAGENVTDYAAYMSIDEEEECVEILRRIAELVVIGERVAADHAVREDKRRKLEEAQSWGKEITSDVIPEHEAQISAETEKYLPVFDHFFALKGLETIVNLLTGKSFHSSTQSDFPVATGSEGIKQEGLKEERPTEREDPEPTKTLEPPDSENTTATILGQDQSDTPSTQEESPDAPIVAEKVIEKETKATSATENENGKKELRASQTDELPAHKSNGVEVMPKQAPRLVCRMLPPIVIATQALQSVSILVQNVKRATSLYFVLSNDLVNELIDLPLDRYSAAEQKAQELRGLDITGTSNKPFVTPELAEMTTHYITFLKSLALRMNAETLQFFLKYPEGEKSTATVQLERIGFPLYDRALEFCAAHHDSFVRLTAMNICLNTLRLTTVSPPEGQEAVSSMEMSFHTRQLCSSPDGVLYNADPLPMQERLAIATHICSPSRVEKLIMPIFSKLAGLWGTLEARYLQMDSSLKDIGTDLDSNVKSERRHDEAIRQQKLQNSFQDSTADLQDELLLLDDVLKVGLTALNEQIIEMMLATFVYPLLLQPLLLYFQSLPYETLQVDNPFTTLSFDRSTVDFDQVGRAPPYVSAPAKTALFTLASVFHLVTNPSLVRLLFTALLHPLAPDSTTDTVSPTSSCVTTLENGEVRLRIDDITQDKNWDIENRAVYEFGMDKSIAASETETGVESCSFVLASGLAKVLKLTFKDLTTIDKSRQNPYRRALLQCLLAPHNMSDFRMLAVNTLDTAMSVMKGTVVEDILLGYDFLGESADGISDEQSESSINPVSEPLDDVLTYAKMNCAEEVVEALRASLMNATPGPFGTWKLDFDNLAAHALIRILWVNKSLVKSTVDFVRSRYWQAATLLSEIPSRIPTTQHLGGIMYSIFYEGTNTIKESPVQRLFQLGEKEETVFCTGISRLSTYDERCNGGVEKPSPSVNFDTYDEGTARNIGAAGCNSILSLDAFLNFISELHNMHTENPERKKPFGFVLSEFRELVDCEGFFKPELSQGLYAPISKELFGLIHDCTDDRSSKQCPPQPLPGAVVGLAGRTAMPCVCESSDFEESESGAKMEVEGVVWQSLYLVFFGPFMVLAEPVAGSTGNGRVISSCQLGRLTVEKEAFGPADVDSPARRILVLHECFEKTIPELFSPLHDEKTDDGTLRRVRMMASKIDIWFEDEKAANLAFHSIRFHISSAKTRRGDRLLDYLSPDPQSS